MLFKTLKKPDTNTSQGFQNSKWLSLPIIYYYSYTKQLREFYNITCLMNGYQSDMGDLIKNIKQIWLVALQKDY